MTGRTSPTLLALLGAALLLPTPLVAQDTTPPDRRAEMRTGAAAMMGVPGPAALGLALEHADYLELSAEQRNRIEALRAEHSQVAESARAVISAHRNAQRIEMRSEMEARRDSLRDQRVETRQELREEMQQRMQGMDRQERQQRTRAMDRQEMQRRMQAMDRQRLREDARPGRMRSTMRSDMRSDMPTEVREAHATLLRLQRESAEGLREILDEEQLRGLRTLTAVDRVRPLRRPMMRPAMQRQGTLSMQFGPTSGGLGWFWR